MQCPPITANCYEACFYEDSNRCVQCNTICNGKTAGIERKGIEDIYFF